MQIRPRIHDICYINNFDSALEFLEKNKETYEILWNASTDRRIYDEMTEIIRDNILSAMKSAEKKTVHQKKCASLYAYLFASNMMSLIQWWFQYYGTVTRSEIEQIMTDNMHLGLFRTFKKQMENGRTETSCRTFLQKSSSHLPPYMRLHIIIGSVVDKEPDLATRDHNEEHRV